MDFWPKKYVIIDTYNMIYQARVKWVNDAFEKFHRGSPLVYSFLRILKAKLDLFKPNVAFVALEGWAKWREDLLPNYKSSREEFRRKDIHHARFKKERTICIKLLPYLGLNVVQHDDLEADDIIYFLCKLSDSKDKEVIVISTDKDMVQLYDHFENVKVFNQVGKKFRDRPELNFLAVRAFLGDSSDEIPKIPKIGPKTAEKLIRDPKLFEQWKRDNPLLFQDYLRNMDLMDFKKAEKEIGDFRYVIKNSIHYGHYDPIFFKQLLFRNKIYSLTKPEKFAKFIKPFEEMNCGRQSA